MYQLVLPEGASEAMERLLAQQRCPRHPGTTTDGVIGDCAMCRVERLPRSRAKAQVREPRRIYR